MSRPDARKAFMLVEVIAVVGIIVLVSGLFWGLANRLIQLNISTSHAINCMVSQDDLVDRIRQDWVDARALPATVGNHHSDGGHLLIQREDKVIRYAAKGGSVSRRVLPPAGQGSPTETERWELFKTDVRFAVGDLVRQRDILFIDVETRIRVGAGRTTTRKTHYELVLP